MRVWSGSGAGARVLARLTANQEVLAATGAGAPYAVLPRGDRRRRPLALVAAATVEALVRDGALAGDGDGAWRITPAGRAAAARGGAAPDEAFRAQHEPVAARVWMDGGGALRGARGVDPDAALARLEAMTDARGAGFFAPAELNAARTLRADFARGQQGLMKISDWSAPPRGGGGARGAGADSGPAAALDARARVNAALAALSPTLAATVRAVCLEDAAPGALERDNALPARSGKVALKLALAQLAHHYARG